MADVQGIRDTLNVTQAGRVIDMSNDISLLDAGRVPLLFMAGHPYTSGEEDDRSKPTVAFNKRTAFQPRFAWMEDTLVDKTSIALAASTVVASAVLKDITVTNSANIRLNDILHFPIPDLVGNVFLDGEIMRVESIVGNVLTVTRNYGVEGGAALGTGMDNILADAVFFIIGNASEEGQASPSSVVTTKTEVFNYTQIFRTPFDVTNTYAASKNYGQSSGPLAYQRRLMGIDHAVRIERAFLYGKINTSGSTGTNGQPLRTTRGILKTIATNRASGIGAMTEAAFNGYLQTVFRYGSSRKMIFAAPTVCSIISSYATNKFAIPHDITTVATEMGIRIMRYNSFHGVVDIVRHNDLEGQYGGSAVIVDTDNISYVKLAENGIDRDTKLKTGIQANDEDRVREEYLTECGLEVRLEQSHMRLDGITS